MIESIMILKNEELSKVIKIVKIRNKIQKKKNKWFGANSKR